MGLAQYGGTRLYVTTTQELAEAVDQLMACSVVAIDTEFMRERTYYSRLCLIQIAGGDHTFLIDPLGEINLDPLRPLLLDPKITKVFHAGTQDLEIFFNRFGEPVAPVFDTQLAATLIGYPEQVSYGSLVHGECGVQLEKTDGFTDWSKRPLTADQITYARNDVTYLLRVYPLLQEKIASSGRQGWLDGEFARMANRDTWEIDTREVWRKVKRISSLNPRALAVVREIAEFREVESMRRNLPRRWVLPDEAIVQIAHRKPKSRDELEGIRGVTKVATSRANEVLEAVRRAVELPETELPSLERTKRPSFDTDPGVDLVVALVRQRAKDNNVAMSQLATRAQIEEFVSSHGERGVLNEGWRDAMVGEEARALLAGELTLSLSQDTLVVERKTT